MDDEIAGSEVREIGLRGYPAAVGRTPRLRATPAEDLRICK